MPETYIGSSNTPVSGDLAAKIAESGSGGMAHVVAAAFGQAMTHLEVMGAPQEVKDAANNFAKALGKWIESTTKQTAAAPAKVAGVRMPPKK